MAAVVTGHCSTKSGAVRRTRDVIDLVVGPLGGEIMMNRFRGLFRPQTKTERLHLSDEVFEMPKDTMHLKRDV